MMKCNNCKKEVDFVTKTYIGDLCSKCKIMLKQKNEAAYFLRNCGISIEDKTNTIFNPWIGRFICQDDDEQFYEKFIEHYSSLPKLNVQVMSTQFLLGKSFDDLVNEVNNKNFNKMDFLDKIFESVHITLEKKKIEERTRKHKIKIQAEKEVFGKEKNNRQAFSEDEKESIISYFNHECVICCAKEGLHIHHKDKNPSNNQMSNLLVLCGVCHKKVHMNVR